MNISRISKSRSAARLVAACAAVAFTGSFCFAKQPKDDSAPAAPAAPGTVVPVQKEQAAQVVRVNATNQAYDFIHPWSKKAPYSHKALGAVISGNRVLVTAELVANSNYVELEKAESGEKTAANVDIVDYEANLAILSPVNENFLKGIKPLDFKDAQVGDKVAIWQLEDTGSLLSTAGLITSVGVSHYPIDDTALLTYELTASLQYRESSFTVPVVKDDKLVGMLMRYDARTQNVDVIPNPVIQHFLTAAAKKEYHGFPKAGVLYAPLRDPQLRTYAGLKRGPDTGGVYITEVVKHGPGDNAGLQVGDVILAIGGKAIDQDGDYVDPQSGKLSLVNLVSTKSFDGDVVKFKILRKGATKDFDVTLANRPADDYVIEPYTVGKAPKFYVLGGLVLEELSRQYLKEWGGDWFKKAPLHFVYMDAFQSELFPEGHQKVIILSQTLPTPSTIGYEDLGSLVVTKINDVPLNSIEDVEKALKNPVNGFDKIEFDEAPKVIYLDPKEVEAEGPLIMKNYGLPFLKRLE